MKILCKPIGNYHALTRDSYAKRVLAIVDASVCLSV